MGLVNLRALSLLSLLSPLLCSSLSWLLLFITSGVTVGAMPREVGSKPHPYCTFLGKASQNKKDLPGPLDLFHCSQEPVGEAGYREIVGPVPSLLPCLRTLPL